MIEFQPKAPASPVMAPIAATWALSYTFDEQEAMTSDLHRLIALIDTALPPANTMLAIEAAETIAAKVIRHLTLFEGAWFSRKRTQCWLYGLTLGGVSTSACTCRFFLLRNWQRTARTRLGALS